MWCVHDKIQQQRRVRRPQQRRARFKFVRSGLRCGAILVMAVDQGCLGGPETRIRARKVSELAEISAIQGVARIRPS